MMQEAHNEQTQEVSPEKCGRERNMEGVLQVYHNQTKLEIKLSDKISSK